MNQEAIANVLADPLFWIWLVGILPSIVIMRATDYDLDAVTKDEFSSVYWAMALLWPITIILLIVIELGPSIVRAPNWIVDRSAMALAWVVGRLVKGITR
jgi:hypothetical protein